MTYHYLSFLLYFLLNPPSLASVSPRSPFLTLMKFSLTASIAICYNCFYFFFFLLTKAPRQVSQEMAVTLVKKADK